MSDERSHFAQRIDERKFSLSRRGYDKREVRSYLEDLEQAFRELEGHGRRTAQRVADLERDLADARATEKVSVDNAMMAVFDAKDRILERARRRADEIEEQAHSEAGRIKSAAIAGAQAGAGPGGSEIAAATAQADEIIASARREAERIRHSAEVGPANDLEDELDAVTAQLRRAHADTASAKEQLDSARKRIVELESGVAESNSHELEERFAELESMMRAARDENSRLNEELAARDEQVKVLEEAVSEANRAREENQQLAARVESESEADSIRIDELEAEVTRLLNGSADQGDRSNSDADAEENVAPPPDLARFVELEGIIAEGERQLADSRQAIADLEAQLAERPERPATQDEADAVLVAAREEAEALKAEAEEEAEQRAAQVIARAREEADQVRQTVATLTAQAEDARSAALRSKLEAENLAESQRSMGEAREDIIAEAKIRAEEIEQEAQRSAESLREQTEGEVAQLKAEVEQMKLEAEQHAAQVIAEAQEEAASLATDAATGRSAASSEELAAMLIETERDLAVSDDLRQRRAELDAREQELVRREQALNARQLAQAQTQMSASDPLLLEAEEDLPDASAAEDTEVGDPAERLGALLEAAATMPAEDSSEAIPRPEAPGTISENVSVDLDGAGSPESRARVAWPTPGETEPKTDAAADDEDLDDDEQPRETHYRTRSAKLPRLGEQAKSNMTTMANLRKKSHKDD